MGKAGGRSSASMRAGLGKTVLHGLVGWGVLTAMVASFLSARIHSAESYRDPRPPFSVRLTKAQARPWRSFPMYTRAVPVLEYHGISGPPTYLTISRYLFAKQMAALKAGGFHPITIKQYVRFLHGDYRGLPTRPILLTFDDGRLDAYRAALNVLAPLHFHAVDIVVPGWVTTNARFSQDWSEMQQMQASGLWDIQAHFGYGHESIPVNAAGKLGGAFADLEWIKGRAGKPGHLETFAQFKKRFVGNMEYAITQLKAHIPGYEPDAMAIPRGDYGEAYTNDPKIPPYVVSWLDQHFQAVFGGDYLSKSANERFWIGGRRSRVTPQIDYRMTMGQRDILPVLYCRLRDYALDTPTWREYLCYHRGKKKPELGNDNDGDGDGSLAPLAPGLRRAVAASGAAPLTAGRWAEPAGRRPRLA